jgi:hypothetical protein
LVTGALPAEFGMRTVGLVDITTRADIFNNSGTVGVYGGSHGNLTPYAEYGGTFGSNCPTATPASGTHSLPSADCFAGVQYYFTGRYLQTNVGIENPTPAYNAIHDFSQQEKGFAYMSTFIDPTTRLSLIAGTAYSTFQIPNVPGQPVGLNGNPPVTSAFGITSFNSAQLNENQTEFTQYGVLACRNRSTASTGNCPISPATTTALHADPVGDLLINGIASDITRTSYTNGLQGDGSYQINSAHTIRAGFTVSGEQAFVGNSSLVEPARSGTAPTMDAPETITDNVSKLGWLAGVYVQDEWKITDKLHDQRRPALRPDVAIRQRQPAEPAVELYLQAVRVHHVPRRLCALLHAAGAGGGGARQYRGCSTTRPARRPAGQAPIRCCRSARIISMPASIRRYRSDAATRRRRTARTSISGSTPTTRSRPTSSTTAISARRWCSAPSITPRASIEGVEFSGKFHSGNFQAYANLAVAQQRATNVVSNQYLFDNTTPLADLGGLTEFSTSRRTGSTPITTSS